LGGELLGGIECKGALIFLDGGGRIAGFFEVGAESEVGLVGVLPVRMGRENLAKLGVRLIQAADITQSVRERLTEEQRMRLKRDGALRDIDSAGRVACS